MSAASRAAFSVRTCCAVGHEHLAAHVAALLLGRELVLPVHPGSAGRDHRLHQLERVQRATEAGLGVGDDRHQVVGADGAGAVVDLVGAHQRVVDPPDDGRHRVGRVQALVRVGLAGQVGVGGDLPAGEVDGLEPAAHHLHGLVTGQRAERPGEGLGVQRLPQPLGAAAGQRVLLDDGALQPYDVLGGIAALDAGPAGVVGPLLAEQCCLVRNPGRARCTVPGCGGGFQRGGHRWPSFPGALCCPVGQLVRRDGSLSAVRVAAAGAGSLADLATVCSRTAVLNQRNV